MPARGEITCTCSTRSSPAARLAYALEDDAGTRDARARHGFTKPDESAKRFNVCDLDDAPVPPALPEGFRYRTAAGADVAELVAVHRDVWGTPDRPSRVTESATRTCAPRGRTASRSTALVEAADGRLAATR